MNDSKVRYGRRMDVLACEKEAVDADTKKMEKENQMTDYRLGFNRGYALALEFAMRKNRGFSNKP